MPQLAIIGGTGLTTLSTLEKKASFSILCINVARSKQTERGARPARSQLQSFDTEVRKRATN